MKLKALDQISITSVQADSLRPGQEFEVSDAFGTDLMKSHPGKFETISGGKAEPALDNKAEGAAPANKAQRQPKPKK